MSEAAVVLLLWPSGCWGDWVLPPPPQCGVERGLARDRGDERPPRGEAPPDAVMLPPPSTREDRLELEVAVAERVCKQEREGERGGHSFPVQHDLIGTFSAMRNKGQSEHARAAAVRLSTVSAQQISKKVTQLTT